MTYEEMLRAEVLATFGGITPEAWRNSTLEDQGAAIEAARAVNARRKLDTAVAIRMAVGAKDEDWSKWVRYQESFIPDPPPPPPKNKYERAFERDPGALSRAIGRLGG